MEVNFSCSLRRVSDFDVVTRHVLRLHAWEGTHGCASYLILYISGSSLTYQLASRYFLEATLDPRS